MNGLEKEIFKIRVQLEKETNKDMRKILAEQKKQLELMRKKVGSLYMKYADDDGILNISDVDKINIMKDVEKDIVETRDIIAKTTIAIVGASLLKSYVDSYYKTANTINNGVNVNINYNLLRPEFVEAVVNANFGGMKYSDRIWKNTDQLANKLYDVIDDGVKHGTSIQKLSKEIKNTFGSSAYQSQRLVNTEMARVVNNATENIYKDSGVVNKVIWIATLDELTNPEDADLDGTIWDLDDITRPTPPLHPNCRCTIAPYIEGWKPTTRRDNIKKEKIEYTDYNDWKNDI